jgi:hypothetical protein
MADKLITQSELRRRAQRLLDVGEMPSLEELLTVIAESRKKYSSARTETRSEENV